MTVWHSHWGIQGNWYKELWLTNEAIKANTQRDAKILQYSIKSVLVNLVRSSVGNIVVLECTQVEHDVLDRKELAKDEETFVGLIPTAPDNFPTGICRHWVGDQVVLQSSETRIIYIHNFHHHHRHRHHHHKSGMRKNLAVKTFIVFWGHEKVSKDRGILRIFGSSSAASSFHPYPCIMSSPEPDALVYIAACERLDHYQTKVKPALQAFVSQIESAASNTAANQQGGHSADYLTCTYPSTVEHRLPTSNIKD
ncbi:hypothetical protein IV203_018948 [Nitzschia inconspicua]|uniref:Uncharacterized protein n=1 Tax=Nitzschia inconspicua TaxID=303405 RepID=A0A9K3Q733_9STRA|nr:hypothetical protein IV203_018948 [Nitzschia inconspicua]